MLSDKLVRWIRKKAELLYNKAELDVAIELLDYYLMLCENPEEDIRALEQMCDASDSDKEHLIKESFSDIETFMKKLGALVKPSQMANPPMNSKGKREWTLGKLYSRVFGVVSTSYDLNDDPLPDETASGYRYAYVRLYRFRNMKIHERAKMELDEQDVLDYTVYTLVAKLDLCQRCVRELAWLYRAKQIDQENFIRRICEEYDDATRSGFAYVDVRWLRNNVPANAYTVKNLATSNDDGLRLVKFLGEAGSGKTTALRQIEVILARRHKDVPDTPVPIYIELGTLRSGSYILRNKIAEILKLEGDDRLGLVKTLLESGMLCLLLDGFNEILDPNIKKYVAHEMDSLAGTGARIFMTDRAKARPSDLTLRGATNCYLMPISNDVKKEFFRKSCRDAQILELLLKRLDEDPVYFESINTPIKLKQLVDVTIDAGKLPKDPVRAFIRYLIRRERQEKKDENTEYLEVFLAALALLTEPQELTDDELDEMDEDDLETYLESVEGAGRESELMEIPKLKAVAQMAKYQHKYGYTKADTNECLKLAVDMGILTQEENEEEEEVVSFANRQYQDYFSFMSNKLL